MDKYHVACGLAGIYAGKLKKNSNGEWADRSLCTDAAIESVRDYLFDMCTGQGVASQSLKWKRKDGRIVQLSLSIFDGEE